MMLKKTFKIFWAWQDDQEEIWLQQMAQQGWGLRDYNVGFYTFEKIEPTNYVYKLDFKQTRNNDMEEYLSIFSDAGWEHVAQFGGWHYFRTKAEGATTPEIYSDRATKAQRYKFIANIVMALLAILLVFFITHIVPMASRGDGSFLLWIYLLIFGFGGFGVYKLKIKEKELSE
ncbi:DUF2812 domain-containing protein [Bacillus sp. HMF5848]|uniref:DUF2812 domain-containing protein n=1 Tax=Bacillus sp. HMF5848 TaxID=2495421 RepID=UPI000F79C130|nr:DUF2812 domain-containing protein [Bacillus sp. HMF5848]RSK28830.1 DUF2812 domain-containing protein [Bacillus sp. HMF5848]